LDVVFTQLQGKPLLLRNDQTLGNQWLRIKLSGKTGNLEGIGSVLKLKSGNVTQWRLVTGTRSYLSQSETVATFGLGAESNEAELSVLWPDGTEQVLFVSEFRTTLVIDKP
ncbi:MAG TPA: CRTAC1 family protein, partial [Verrucomicrobiales bacterium]|nr:CRTAC1 family protein [Verrucomicrobiales bacterium]